MTGTVVRWSWTRCWSCRAAARAAHRCPQPARQDAPRRRRHPRQQTEDELLDRRRAELRERLREVDADYESAEKERAEAESQLDANEHHIADIQTAIERLTDEVEQSRRELRHAQSRTRKLERALNRAARLAAATRRRRDAQQQRLKAFNA